MAIAATSAKPIATAANADGSNGAMPNNIDSIDRAAAAATINPAATPAIVSASPRRMTSDSTWPALAPSAMRTPISWVRCATA